MARLTSRQRGYTRQWEKARRLFLSDYPMCAECYRRGRHTLATVVDHIIPHKGDAHLFWDECNWQALCSRCHNLKTANEDGAFGHRPSMRGCDADGMPTSKHHPWNRRA
jgi:5-methylcytosine-specific restriction enzyme A